MAAVSLAVFKRWLRKKTESSSEDADLQETLDAAHDVVAHRTGRPDPDAPLRVYARNGVLLLPAAGLSGVGAVINPAGVTVDNDQLDIDLDAGIIRLGYAVVTTARGPWQVSVTTPEGEAPLRLAVLIIAEHLWGLRRGSGDSGARAAAVVRNVEEPIVPVGYAVPNRAAELMAPFTLAIGFA